MKYFVAYTVKGGLLVEAADPREAKDKVADLVTEFKGNMETSVSVFDLDELA